MPLWLVDGVLSAGRADAARLIRPEFRARIAEFTVGPLLARTFRGGLFAVVDGDQVLPRTALEIGLAHPSDRAHRVLVRAVAHAANHGLAQVHATGQFAAADATISWALVERVNGWTLRTLLGRRGLAFTGRRLAALGAELADALAALGPSCDGVRLVHGRLSVGHVVIDTAGRARLVGSPVDASAPGLLPDAIGLGMTLACAALGMAPDPRGSTTLTVRALASALDRTDGTARVGGALRRLIQSLLSLDPHGFLPSMPVLRSEFIRLMQGLPLGVSDPAWGRSLSEAVRGLAPTHRPTVADAEGVLLTLGRQLPVLGSGVAQRPPPPMLVEEPVSDAPPRSAADPAGEGPSAPRLRLVSAPPMRAVDLLEAPLSPSSARIDGAEVPEGAEPVGRTDRRRADYLEITPRSTAS